MLTPVVLNIRSQLALLSPRSLAELGPLLFCTIISETTATACAYGINLSSSIEQDIWARVNDLPSGVRASTAVDLEKGLPNAMQINLVNSLYLIYCDIKVN